MTSKDITCHHTSPQFIESNPKRDILTSDKLTWIFLVVCATKVVEYLPSVCLTEGCLDYLYIMKYGLSLCEIHWVSAVAVVEVVVVVADYHNPSVVL